MTALGEAAWIELTAAARPLDESALRALSPMLIVSPHQDDETLGCGGLIAAAADLGLKPRVAYLTDGAASHRGSPTWPAARLADTRREEAIAALAALGVPADDALFLGWADAAPLPAGPGRDATLATLLAWARRSPPASLWAPWALERHCDHSAAAALSIDLAARLDPTPRVMDYLVWGWSLEALRHEGAGREVWSLACAATIPRRRAALACHRTQTTNLIDDASEAFLIPPAVAALVERPVEVFLSRP